MKRIFGIILIVVAAMMSASCIEEVIGSEMNEDQSAEKVQMTFSAVSDADTRLALVDRTQIWWEPNDEIFINGDWFASTLTAPSFKSDFIGETVPSDEYYAVSRKNIAVEWNGESYAYELIPYQAAEKGNLPVFLSAAKVSDSSHSLQFNNLLGYIKFTIPEDSWDIYQVDIEAIGRETISAGGMQATIDFSGDKPVLSPIQLGPDEYPYNVLSLCFETKIEPGDYYAALYPRALSKGLKFTFYSKDGKVGVKSIRQEITLEPGVIKNIGIIDNLQDQHELERNALIDLYNATDGDNWTVNTNWCSDRPLEEWYGVSVDTYNGFVYGISLNLNNLVGTIPSSIADLTHLDYLYLNCNVLTGDIPQELQELQVWNTSWWEIVRNNNFNPDSYKIFLPDFRVISEDGSVIDNSFFAENEYTIVYFPGRDCPYSDIYNPYLINTYRQYNEYGVEAITVSSYDNFEYMLGYADDQSIPWKSAYVDMTTRTLSYVDCYIYYSNPNIILVDKDGEVVFESLTTHRNLLDLYLENLIESGQPGEDLYESTDYSMDGQVETILSASKGNGINIVILGDAYSDKMINDGTFRKDADYVTDMIFSVEPFAGFKDLFNVYAVNAVSCNHKYWGEYDTVFSPLFSEYESISGVDNEKVKAYVGKILSEEEIQEAVIIVLLRDSNLTTSNLSYIDYQVEWEDGWTDYDYLEAVGDFGRGGAIVAMPWQLDYDTIFRFVLNDAMGEGFAKLCDEVNGLKMFMAWEKERGWYKNIAHPEELDHLPWEHFINDERYINEGIGVYSAQFPYMELYAATEKSIMNNMAKYYNAPSRESIYYRIHKLAYGPDWKYDYEKFVDYDLVKGL